MLHSQDCSYKLNKKRILLTKITSKVIQMLPIMIPKNFSTCCQKWCAPGALSVLALIQSKGGPQHSFQNLCSRRASFDHEDFEHHEALDKRVGTLGSETAEQRSLRNNGSPRRYPMLESILKSG